MNELAELNTQKKIYGLIEENPGLNITKIAHLLNSNVPLVLYHLRRLVKNDIVTLEKENGYTRCYIKGEICTREKKMFSVLRQDIPLKIVLFLLRHPYSKHKEILDEFSIAKSTLSYHLKKLLKLEIINLHTIGEEQGYAVQNEKQIINFLLQYKPSRVAFGLKDTWADFTIYAEKDIGD